MQHKFTKKITPFVKQQLTDAKQARKFDVKREFFLLERAHILGQGSTYWHVKVHILMLAWAMRNHSFREATGQIFRIFAAAALTVFGLVPSGNTGGTNISPFKKVPNAAELATLIDKAKSES